MKNIIVSAQNALLSEAIVNALRQRGQFRCQPVPADRTRELAAICHALPADILLMEVNHLSASTLEKRLALAQKIRQQTPGCRLALLCDEIADPDLAERVMHAKQFNQVDGFFYTSVSASYLSAALEAL